MSDLTDEHLERISALATEQLHRRHPMVSDATDVIDLVSEVKRHRAMVKRLEELALSLEHNFHMDMRKLAAELRNRMRSP